MRYSPRVSQELSQVCYGDEALWEAGSRYLRTQARKSLVRILGAFCQAPSRTKTNPGSGSNASRSSSGQPGNSLLQKCTRADGIRADSIRSPCVRMIHNADSLWVKSGRTPPLWRYRVHKDEGGVSGTAAVVSLPVRFFDAVDTGMAPVTVLHALIMVTAPHSTRTASLPLHPVR